MHMVPMTTMYTLILIKNNSSDVADAHDNTEVNNNDNVAATDGEDRPELHNHEGQAGDQLPEEDEHNDRDVPFDDNKNVDGDNKFEDDNNDGDNAVTPQFDSEDLYKALGY